MRYLFLLNIILLFPSFVYSRDIHVPGDYPTIQEAINAALDNDLVLVHPGTYVENIDFQSKNISIKSTDGPDYTIIDGSQAGTVVNIVGVGINPVLDGFTITNGSAHEGGGIYCRSDAHIINNIIINNIVFDIYGSKGAGIYCHSFISPIIEKNIISLNVASSVSGVSWGGGILCLSDSFSIIKYNIVSDNVADEGGGIFCKYYSPLIIGNTFVNNSAINGGGLQCFDNSSPQITNNIFSCNSALGTGGGIHIISSSPILTNNTFVNNFAGIAGGGIYSKGPIASPTIANTILWDDDSSIGPEIYIGDSSNPSTMFIYYSDVKGGQNSIHIESGCSLTWGSGMKDSNPLFVNINNGDYHLTYESPCLNSGTNIALYLPDKDYEGDSRKAYGVADIGADEFYTHLYYTGNPTPGGIVYVKIVGIPEVTPVGLFIGTGILDQPLSSIWGDWYLEFPIIGPIDLGKIPSPNGILIVKNLIPITTPIPSTFPIQVLVGDNLTNLLVLEIK